MKPTEKQINRVEHMAYIIGISVPEEFSKSAYSRFISEHKEEYVEELTENDWQYDLDKW